MTSDSIPLALFLFVFAIPFGVASGALITDVVERAAQNKQPTIWRSRCPRCRKKVPLWQALTPILAFFVCRGRMRCCGARMSPALALVPAACGAFSGLYGIVLKTTLPSSTGLVALHAAHVAACFTFFAGLTVALITMNAKRSEFEKTAFRILGRRTPHSAPRAPALSPPDALHREEGASL